MENLAAIYDGFGLSNAERNAKGRIRLLQDEKIWLDMLEDRNLSTHDYGFEMAKDIADRISNKYAKCLAALAKYVGDAI